MKKQQLLEFLKEKQACAEALTWIADTPGTPAELWQACPRGDWLLWLCGRVGFDRRLLVRAAIGCAYPALAYLPAGEERPRRALETALSWCEGGASLGEVEAAACDAYAATRAATRASDAAYAATRAADAADAAYASVHAAWAAVHAAWAARAADAADATDAADAADAAEAAEAAVGATEQESLAHSADIVRRHIKFSAVVDFVVS